MRMMTIPECVAALGGKLTSQQLRYGIRMGYYKSIRIGGKLLVDCDTVEADAAVYRPQHSYPGGLVSRDELMRATGLSRRQVDHGIREGWITQHYKPGRRRPMYSLRQVETYLQVQLTREDGEDSDDR